MATTQEAIWGYTGSPSQTGERPRQTLTNTGSTICLKYNIYKGDCKYGKFTAMSLCAANARELTLKLPATFLENIRQGHKKGWADVEHKN